jgi:hypothetical protein
MLALNADASIFVTFTEVGFHRWDNAPAHRAYLRSDHRHVFHVRVEMAVSHDDREVEFHDLIDRARAEFRSCSAMDSNDIGDYGPQSCEMMARTVAELLSFRFTRPVQVGVSEDGEVGAMVLAVWPKGDKISS